MDGMLSQDEINALLSGMNTGGDDTSDSSTATTTIPEDNANDNTDGGFTLTESEKDAVGEISNISMGTAATTLSSLLSQKVNITTPKVEVATWDDYQVNMTDHVLCCRFLTKKVLQAIMF